MGQTRMRLSLCAVTIGAVALIVTAALITTAARADQTPVGTIAVARGCYVNTARSAAQITITGAGWQPGDTVELSDRLQVISATATANSAGGFSVSVPAPVVDSSAHSELPDQIEAYDEADPGLTSDPGSATAYSTAFLTTDFAVIQSGNTRDPAKKTTFALSGFTPGRTVYAHYLTARGRPLTTVSVGRPSGACGLRRVSTDLYPGGHLGRGTYTIQFDDARRYASRTVPSYRLSFSVPR